jgi:hypothetical protein
VKVVVIVELYWPRASPAIVALEVAGRPTQTSTRRIITTTWFRATAYALAVGQG